MRKLILVILMCFVGLRLGIASDNQLKTLEEDNKRFYEEALKHSPDNVSILVAYSNTLCALGELGKAYQFAKRAYELAPENEEVLINLAAILFATRKYEDFLSVLSKCKEINPRNPAIYCLLAMYYKRQGRKEDQLAMLSEMYEYVDASKPPRYGQHINFPYTEDDIFIGLGKGNLEIFILHEIPEYTGLYDDIYSTTPLTNEECQKVEKLLSELMRKYPSFSKLRKHYVYLKGLQKDYDAAEKTLKQMLENAPGDVEAIIMLAQLYLSQNQIEQSLKLMLDSEKFFAKSPTGYYSLATIYEATGNKRNAIKYLEKCITALNTMLENDPMVTIDPERAKYLKDSILAAREKIKKLKESSTSEARKPLLK